MWMTKALKEEKENPGQGMSEETFKQVSNLKKQNRENRTLKTRRPSG